MCSFASSASNDHSASVSHAITVTLAIEISSLFFLFDSVFIAVTCPPLAVHTKSYRLTIYTEKIIKCLKTGELWKKHKNKVGSQIGKWPGKKYLVGVFYEHKK